MAAPPAAAMAPPAGFEQVTEGRAAILFPATTTRDVFYNKAQVVNRDLSVLVLRAFGDLLECQPGKKMQSRELVVLEALAASGLRSLRFWKEVPKIHKVIVNDYSDDAFVAMKRNMEYNGVPVVALEDEEKGLVPSQADAVSLMLRYRSGAGNQLRPNVIDLDPYGTAVPFLDAAVQAVDDGGLLLVTCTDAAVLCGTYPETCYAKYGAITCKAKYCHEMAVRIVLGHIEKLCNKYSRYIVPLVSLSIDFYVRVVVRVFQGKNEAKHSVSRISHLYQCSECCAFHLAPVGKATPSKKSQQRARAQPAQPDGAESTAAPVELLSNAATPPPTIEEVCTAAGPSRTESAGLHFSTTTFALPPNCEVCGHRFWVAGPLYSAPIHCPPFVRYLLSHLSANSGDFQAFERVRGLLVLAAEELPESPLFYHLPTLCANIKTQTPQIAKVRAALKQLGYRVSPSHCDADALKTNAPNTVVYDIMRCWHRLQQEEGAIFGTSALAKTILATPPAIQAEFSYRMDCDYSAKVTGVAKHPINEPFWGPMARAKPSSTAAAVEADGGGSAAKKPRHELAESAAPGAPSLALDATGHAPGTPGHAPEP